MRAGAHSTGCRACRPVTWRGTAPSRSSYEARALRCGLAFRTGCCGAEASAALGRPPPPAEDAKLTAGAYRAVFETQDRFGKKVTGFAPLQVLNPNADKLALKVPDLIAAPKWSLEPGEEFMAVWGTGYDQGRAFIEIEHRNNMLKRFWTDPKVTQVQIRQALNEAMRGGFTLHVTRIQENRAHLASRHVDVTAAGDVAPGLEDSTTTGRGLGLVRQPREKARARPLVAIGSARIRSRAGHPPGAIAEPSA